MKAEIENKVAYMKVNRFSIYLEDRIDYNTFFPYSLRAVQGFHVSVDFFIRRLL